MALAKTGHIDAGTPARPHSPIGRAGMADQAFRYLTMAFSLTAVALIIWIGIELFIQCEPTRKLFGWHMLTSRTWDVPKGIYGALPVIYGSLVTAAISMVVAVPLGIG